MIAWLLKDVLLSDQRSFDLTSLISLVLSALIKVPDIFCHYRSVSVTDKTNSFICIFSKETIASPFAIRNSAFITKLLFLLYLDHSIGVTFIMCVIGNIDTHYTEKQVHFPESKEKLMIYTVMKNLGFFGHCLCWIVKV